MGQDPVVGTGCLTRSESESGAQRLLRETGQSFTDSREKLADALGQVVYHAYYRGDYPAAAGDLASFFAGLAYSSASSITGALAWGEGTWVGQLTGLFNGAGYLHAGVESIGQSIRSLNPEQFDRGIGSAFFVDTVGAVVALPKLLGSAAEFVAGRWRRQLDSIATTRTSTLDFMDGRPVSGQTGHLGSQRLTRAEQMAFRNEMAELEVRVERNADKFLDAMPAAPQAGFDHHARTIYLRKNATFYNSFHEKVHARQLAELGIDDYLDLGRFKRERHVFSEIRKNRDLFSPAERKHAIDYILQLRNDHRLGHID